MPVKHDIRLSLKTNEVLRRGGFREYSKIGPEVKSLILELLASVNDLHLLEPAIAYESYLIAEVHHNQVYLKNGAVLQGWLLPSLLTSAKELAAVVCTIGPKLEKRATDYFSRGKPLRGMLLDGIGSAAVDSLA